MANLARNSTPSGSNNSKSAFVAGTNLSANSAPAGTNKSATGFIEKSRIWNEDNTPWSPDSSLPWQDNEIVPEFDIDGTKTTRNTAPSGTKLTRN